MPALRSRRAMIVFFLVGFGIPWLGWTTVALWNPPASPLKTALFYTGDFMAVAGRPDSRTGFGRSWPA